MYKKIVVPLDGSPLAEAALPIAVDIATCMHSELVLMRGADDMWIEDMMMPQQLEAFQIHIAQDCHTYLEAIATKLRANGLSATTLVTKGDPANQILEVVTLSKADAIVMATHGYGGLKRLMVGSVADKVLHHASVPVVLVRPNETTVKPFSSVQRSLFSQEEHSEVY